MSYSQQLRRAHAQRRNYIVLDRDGRLLFITSAYSKAEVRKDPRLRGHKGATIRAE